MADSTSNTVRVPDFKTVCAEYESSYVLMQQIFSLFVKRFDELTPEVDPSERRKLRELLQEMCDGYNSSVWKVQLAKLFEQLARAHPEELAAHYSEHVKSLVETKKQLDILSKSDLSDYYVKREYDGCGHVNLTLGLRSELAASEL